MLCPAQHDLVPEHNIAPVIDLLRQRSVTSIQLNIVVGVGLC